MDLLAYLRSIQGSHVLSGQEVPEDGRTPTPAQLLALPQAPAIVGANILVGDADDYSHDASVQQILSAHANAGGIISLCMHPPNFFSGSQNISTAWVADPTAAKPNLSTLLAGTSTARSRYLRAVQRVIAYVQTLPPMAPVVFRPWHELTGTWFFWGVDQTNPSRSESGVKALWSDTVARVKAACPNVLAGWSTGLSWYADELYGYPSGVDIAGTSLYSDSMDFAHTGDYAKLASLGKPMWLFEVGNLTGNPGWDATLITSNLASRYPAVTAWVSWQDGYSLLEMSNSAQALSDPRTVNRSGLTPQQPKSFVYASATPSVTLYAAPNSGALVKIPVY